MSANEFVVGEKTYVIKTPTAKQNQEARRIYNRTFSEAVKDNCMLREEIVAFARERGIISETSEAESDGIRREMVEIEEKLETGGIELEEAKNLAIKLQILRNKLVEKSGALAVLLSNSAERQAENARDDYLMSVCICSPPATPVCRNLDDFLSRQDDEVITAGIIKYQEVFYGLSSDWVNSLPENKFLIEYNFMNEQFQMLDGDGNPIVAKSPEKKPFLKDGVPVEPKSEPVSA